MNPRSLLTGLSTLLVSSALLASTHGSAAADPDYIRGVKLPDPHAPLTSWTAAQQYMPDEVSRHYGFPAWDGWMVLADELGDRLSQLGRAAMMHECFGTNAASAYLMSWAMCRTDFAALDLAKVEAELVAAGVAADERADTMTRIKRDYANAKAVVDKLDGEAPRDPGLQKLLTDVEAGKQEWAAYAAGHAPELALYGKLRDAVRSGKRNDPGFDGCDALTRPPFEKLVRSVAKKIPWETETLEDYMSYVTTTTEAFITTASWAACGYSIHPSMTGLLGQAVTVPAMHANLGWRTLALSKIAVDGYKPRFADSSYYLPDQGKTYVHLLGVDKGNGNPTFGEVKKLTKQDDELLISFKTAVAEDVCLRWETRYGEKQCAERGDVPDEYQPEAVPTAYSAGIKPNVSVMVQGGFPVEVYNKPKKKMLALFGVALK